MVETQVIKWEDAKTLLVNDIRFFVTFDPNELLDIQSSEDHFLLGKAPPMVERSIAMGKARRINKVFEIGIFKGGSVVLYDQIFQPQKIAAVDLSKEPVKALSDYIVKRGKQDRVRPYYGVDQGDRAAMERIMSSEFPNRDIDLIVDDASHLYEQTRTAFNVAFPYLAVGGNYVIEDWAWAHWAGPQWQIRPWQFWKRPPFNGGRALSNLLIELFMLTASRPDLIEDILVTHNLIVVTRGKGELPAGDFDIGDHYLMRGKRFGAWL